MLVISKVLFTIIIFVSMFLYFMNNFELDFDTDSTDVQIQICRIR